MTTEQISRLARSGNLPENAGLSCPERCLFHTLKGIYSRFEEKKITAEQGEKEKKAALMQYQKDSAEYQGYKIMIRHQAKLWQNIELAANEYRKTPSIDHADSFLEAVYGIKRNREEKLRELSNGTEE